MSIYNSNMFQSGMQSATSYANTSQTGNGFGGSFNWSMPNFSNMGSTQVGNWLNNVLQTATQGVGVNTKVDNSVFVKILLVGGLLLLAWNFLRGKKTKKA